MVSNLLSNQKGEVTAKPENYTADLWFEHAFLIAYVVQGAASLIFNGAIALTIASSRSLMKKYLIIFVKVPHYSS